MPTNRSMLQKLLSEETRRLADPQHPGHDMYRQAYGEVESLKAKHGVAPSDRDKDFAASIAVGAKAQGLYQVDHVLLSDDGSKTFAAISNRHRCSHRSICLRVNSRRLRLCDWADEAAT